MTEAREKILARLRESAKLPPHNPNPLKEREKEWQERQAPLGDLATRFTVLQEGQSSKVIRVPD